MLGLGFWFAFVLSVFLPYAGLSNPIVGVFHWCIGFSVREFSLSAVLDLSASLLGWLGLGFGGAKNLHI